ncbi:hypothetical protein BDR03DRAFT_970142 [Suillus americanus]|nr:hypothetical protein BDR03DRAFT_970142 [Suillus americanus]
MIMFHMRYALGSSLFFIHNSSFILSCRFSCSHLLLFVRLSAFASALVYRRFDPTYPAISL